MNTYGERVKVTIFGESHGPAIGVVLDGVPAGEAIDMDAVRIQMRRRAPGSSDLTTHRSETDDPLVMSGILNGVTTGAPISAIFRNKDQNSAAYHPEIPRPSHADYAATVRFGGHADLRGGGPFSGRLTACLVFAGAVCRQILERRGITITANAVRVGQATGKELNFDMKRAILDARSAGDSVGSELECVVTGVPAGVGGLLFGGMESRIAGMLYAIPGVKGVEFGRGFALAEMRGSEANDPIRLKNGRITMASNNAGGINGGITNGMPVEFTVTFRPTPSIAQPQETIDLETMTNTKITIGGRHDACIALRAPVVVESAAALALWRLKGADGGGELDNLRGQLDILDTELTTLFARRQSISRRIGAYKREHHLPVQDTGREEQVLHTRGQLAPERRQQVERLFRLLMELSREEQA